MGAAFGFAFAGLRAGWVTQRNFRIQLVLAVGAIVVGALLRLPPLGWAMLALATALVLSVELMNTALEALVDLASPELHPLAKRAKDVAAAAVLVAAGGALAVGALVVAASRR